MQIAKNTVVSVHYTLTNDQGEILDASDAAAPLAYIQGQNHIIAGLEKALDGQEPGAKLHVTVSPEEGYGVRNDQLVQTIPMSVFEGIDEVQAGMQFHAQTPQGPQLITVTAVEGDQVTIDGNHPLAGETLTFDVEVMDVRPATAEELEHGHVHGPGGHHH